MQGSVLTEVTVTGLTVYGLAVLFLKALLILWLARTLSEQFEFSPASVRHRIWLLSLAGLAILPVLTRVVPPWHIVSIEMPAALEQDILPAPWLSASSHSSFYFPAISSVANLSFADWSLVLYLLVAVARLGKFLAEIVRVGWITAKAQNADRYWYREAEDYVGGRYKLKISAELNVPVTWGTLYPVILLPGDCDRWSALEREMVLRHEAAHIQRRDWLSQLLGQLVAILYWPVPGIGGALKMLSLEAERAADNVVLARGIGPADYAALLLRQARGIRLQATVALGKPSELSQRVRHIVSVYVDRTGESLARALLSVTAAIFLLPLASMQATGRLPVSVGREALATLPVVLITGHPDTNRKPAPVEISRPSRPLSVRTPPNLRPQADVTVMKPEGSALRSDYILDGVSPELNMPRVEKLHARAVFQPRPFYPATARRRGIEGRVIVEFGIDANGAVVNPVVVESVPSRIFNRAVLNAVRNHRYEPPRLNGEAISLTGLREEFRFRLDDGQVPHSPGIGDSLTQSVSTLDSG